MVLPTMGNILIRMSFFRRYSLTLDLKNNLVHRPDLSLQIRPHHGKFSCRAFELKALQKVVVGPCEQVLTITAAELENSFGTSEANPAFPGNPISSFSQQWTSFKKYERPTKSLTRIPTRLPVATKQLSPVSKNSHQDKQVTCDPSRWNTLLLCPSILLEANVINQLFQTRGSSVDKRWYPKPETSEDPKTISPIER